MVYFDSRFTYHIDALVRPLEEGLIQMPKGALWTPLPEKLRDWEVLEITLEDHKKGATNHEPLGNKKIVMPAGTTKFVKDLEKRGWECIEVPYETIYSRVGSGIHCATASIWRES